MENISLHSNNSESNINQDIELMQKILLEWINLRQSSKFVNNLIEIKDFHQYLNDNFSVELSNINCLGKKVEKIMSNQYSNEDFLCSKSYYPIHSLLKCLKMYVKTFEEKEMKILLSDDVTNLTLKLFDLNNGSYNGYHKLFHKIRLRNLVIKLSFVLVHIETVVGLLNLFAIVINNKKNDIDKNSPKSLEDSTCSPNHPLLSIKIEKMVLSSLLYSLGLAFGTIFKCYFYNISNISDFLKTVPFAIFHLFNDNNDNDDKNYNRFLEIADQQDYDKTTNVNFWNLFADEKLKEEESFIIKPIYLIYLHWFLVNDEKELKNPIIEILQKTLKKDCFFILLSIFVINCKNTKKLGNEKWFLSEQTEQITNESINKLTNVEQRFAKSHFQENIRPLLIRNIVFLLVLMEKKSKNQNLSNNHSIDTQLNDTIVNIFRNHLINLGGLEALLEATLDSDQTSEHETTISHRLEALGTMVVRLPIKNKKKYYSELLYQIFNHLLIKEAPCLHPLAIYHRFGSMVLNQINEIDAQLCQEEFFYNLEEQLKQCIEVNINVINIEKNLNILQRLLTFRSCLKKCAQFFSKIFFFRLIFERKQFQIYYISLKDQSEKILISMLTEIPQSIYLLDNCLQNSDWNDLIDVEVLLEKCGDKISHKFENINDKNNELNHLDRINQMTAFVIKILDQMPMDFRFNLFYLILDRLIDSNPPPVVLFLIGPFSGRLFGSTISKQQENDRENYFISSPKTVQFLSCTIERIVNRLISLEPQETLDNLNSNEQLLIWIDTLNICLKILSILLEKLEKNCIIQKGKIKNLTNEMPDLTSIFEELKPCKAALRILLNNSHALKLLPDDQFAESIYTKFEKIFNVENFLNYSYENHHGQIESILNELRNNDFMPAKVHSLITLKQLIVSRHPSVIVKLAEIIFEITFLLRDTESYLYLAAIKTLSALAIYHTDEVLPILMKEFTSSPVSDIRPLSDRLKIAESLKQLAYSIGDFAHHYSSQFINGLLYGINSKEPAIRVSSLSCLGEFCSRYHYGLFKHLVELISMVKCLLITETNIDVRRAAVLFLRLLLQSIKDREMALLVQEYLKPIKDLILNFGNTTLDDVFHKHCFDAYTEICRIANLFNIVS